MAHIEHAAYTHVSGVFHFTVRGTDFGDTTGSAAVGNVVDGEYDGALIVSVDSWDNTMVVFHISDYDTSPSNGLAAGIALVTITPAAGQTYSMSVS